MRFIYPVTIFHGLFGYSSYYLFFLFNPFERWILSFIGRQQFFEYGPLAAFKSSEAVLTQLFWALLQTSAILGLTVAIFGQRYFQTNWGNRNTGVVVMNVLNLIACECIILAMSYNFLSLLYVARFLIGFAFGLNVAVDQLVNDCCPPETKYGVGLILFAFKLLWSAVPFFLPLSTIEFVNIYNWQYAVLPVTIVCVIHLVVGVLLPRTPRYLYLVKNDLWATSYSVNFYYGSNSNIRQVLDALEATQLRVTLHEENRSLALSNVFHDEYLRDLFWTVLLVHLTVPLTGVYLVYSYSSGMLTNTFLFHFDQAAIVAIFMMKAPEIVHELFGDMVYRVFGRKWTMMVALMVSTAGLTMLFVAALLYTLMPWTLHMCISCLGLALVVLGQVSGPLIRRQLIPAELCPMVARHSMTFWTQTIEYSLAIVLCIYYPVVRELIGAFVYLPLIVAVIINGLVLFYRFPEEQAFGHQTAWNEFDLVASLEKSERTPLRSEFEVSMKSSGSSKFLSDSKNSSRRPTQEGAGKYS